jgi:prolyl-tRNA synthetase
VRWTAAFIPTLRDDPADAEAISHKLLVRAGFIRQLASGTYSLLPLAHRVAKKIEKIVREELVKIGAQEFSLPALQPAELWKQSGRWDAIDATMFRLKDRHGADACLGMTHEEVFTTLAKELRSYRQLPQTWFQFQTKFRDEERPKSGLLRVREFVMKDSYSFDKDAAGLDRSFQNHFDAYRKIYDRCGLETIAVQASSGAMGGSESVEFMAETEAGEDWVAVCAACGYAANVEKATSLLPDAEDPASVPAAEKFATPGVRTIDDLARMSGGAAAERQIKTLVYVLDGVTTLVLLRGDHQLVLQKLIDGTSAREVRPASAAEMRAALGASAGSLGAVGVSGVRIIADAALQGRRGMITGANADDFHLRNVDVARDLAVSQWLELRLVTEGEACPECESKLAVKKSVEVGHIFKLGTKYSEALGASVQAEDGKNAPILMGSYGIGVGRLLAAIVERCHDANGIKWPVNVAPYEVAITVLNPKEIATLEAGERLYEALTQLGVDTLLDDRDERPGVKFKDCELIGIPVRVTVGPKGLASGKLEVFFRGSGEKREIDIHKASDFVSESVFEGRRR